MALARVQATPKATGATSAAATFATPPTVGNGIVVGVLAGGTPGITCTDNRGNTYATAHYKLGAINSEMVVIFYCPAITATGAPFTVTLGATAAAGLVAVAVEISGVGGGLVLDASNGGNGSGATPSTQTLTVTLGDRCAVALTAISKTQSSISVASFSTDTALPGWTQEAEQLVLAPSQAGEIDSRVVTVTVPVMNARWTCAASGWWAAAIAVFKATTPTTVAVPDVVGDLQADASTAITAAGLTVGTVTTAPSSTVPAGHVVSQSPAAGTVVALGTAVNLVIAVVVPGLVVTIDGEAIGFRRDTLDITSSINGVDRASGTLDILDASWRPPLGAEVVIAYNGVRLFGGVIDDLSEHAITADASRDLTVEIGAADYNSYTDRRYLRDELTVEGTLKQVLTTHILPYLTEYGVTLAAAQVDGPTIPATAFQYRTVHEVLDDLSTITGYVWNIDYFKQLQMWEPGTNPAPFDILDSERRVLGDITVTPIATEYANRVILRAGPGAPQDWVFGWYGDGSNNTFTMYATVLNHYDFVWVHYPLPDHSETLGAPGSGAEWIFTDGGGDGTTQTISRAAGPVPAGTLILLRAFVDWPITAVVDDLPGQAVNGVIEMLVTKPDAVSIPHVQAEAAGLLARYSTRKKTVRYRTRDAGLAVGQTQNLSITRRELASVYFITELATRFFGDNQTLVWTVTAQEAGTYQGSWRDVYKLWLGEGSGVASSGGSAGSVPSGGGVPGWHHLSHEPGGSDALTALSAAILTTGILPDPRLSANVARRDLGNAFAQTNVFNDVATFNARVVVQNIPGTVPQLFLTDTAPPADARVFRLVNTAQVFAVQALNDAATVVQAQPLVLKRDGDAFIGRDLYEKGRTVPMGEWQDEPFNAANFIGSGGLTWTVAAINIVTNRYTLVGKTLFWMCMVGYSSLTGTGATTLRVTLPGGLSTATSVFGVGKGYQAGGSILVVLEGSGTQLNLLKSDGSNFTPPDSTFYCYFSLACEVM